VNEKEVGLEQELNSGDAIEMLGTKMRWESKQTREIRQKAEFRKLKIPSHDTAKILLNFYLFRVYFTKKKVTQTETPSKEPTIPQAEQEVPGDSEDFAKNVEIQKELANVDDKPVVRKHGDIKKKDVCEESLMFF
jgi:hypothetical protein